MSYSLSPLSPNASCARNRGQERVYALPRRCSVLTAAAAASHRRPRAAPRPWPFDLDPMV
jgi:hypothetical protein